LGAINSILKLSDMMRLVSLLFVGLPYCTLY
jgi:hypothetical protein